MNLRAVRRSVFDVRRTAVAAAMLLLFIPALSPIADAQLSGGDDERFALC